MFHTAAAATFFTPKLVSAALGVGLIVSGALAAWVQSESTGTWEHVSSALRSDLRLDVESVLILAFLGMGLGSVALASSPASALLGVYNQGVGWLLWSVAFLAYLTLRRARLSRGLSDWLLVVLVAGALVVASIALLQAFEWDPLRFKIGFRTDGRAGSTLGNPLPLGAYLGLAAIVALDLARRSASRVALGSCVLAVAVLECGIAVTGSRGAFLSLTAGLAVWLGFGLYAARGGRLRLVLLVAGAGIWMLISVLVFAPDGASTPPPPGGSEPEAGATAVQTEPTSTVRTRLLMWRIALDAALDRPIFGWGPANYSVASNKHMRAEKLELEPNSRDADAHSLPMELAATWGFPAALVFAAWSIYVLIRRIGGRRRCDAAPLAGGLWAAFGVASLTMPQNVVVVVAAFSLLGLVLSRVESQALDLYPRSEERSTQALRGRAAAALRIASGLLVAALLTAFVVGSVQWLRADVRYLDWTVRGDTEARSRATELFPPLDLYWIARGVGEVQEGLQTNDRGAIEEGRSSLDTALALSPENYEGLMALARAHLQMAEWSQAADAAGRMVSAAPLEPIGHAYSAFALRRLGHLEQATREAEAALAVDVRSPVVLYTVGLYYEDAGDYVMAKDLFERALVLDPAFPEARSRLDQLQGDASRG